MKLLTLFIELPPWNFYDASSPSVWARLAFSALYSVVFDWDKGVDKHWAGQHRFMDFPQLGSKAKSVFDLHSAITVQIACSAFAQSQEGLKGSYIDHLSRCMAYTPHPQPIDDARVDRAKENFSKTAHFISAGTQDTTYPPAIPALSCLIWIPKMRYIPHIHGYLQVYLSYRHQLSEYKPAWRDWGGPLDKSHLTFNAEDTQWLASLENDRMLVELLCSLDQLVTDGCSAEEHLILV